MRCRSSVRSSAYSIRRETINPGFGTITGKVNTLISTICDHLGSLRLMQGISS
jgi:hypothetical protein